MRLVAVISVPGKDFRTCGTQPLLFFSKKSGMLAILPFEEERSRISRGAPFGESEKNGGRG